MYTCTVRVSYRYLSSLCTQVNFYTLFILNLMLFSLNQVLSQSHVCSYFLIVSHIWFCSVSHDTHDVMSAICIFELVHLFLVHVNVVLLLGHEKNYFIEYRYTL